MTFMFLVCVVAYFLLGAFGCDELAGIFEIIALVLSLISGFATGYWLLFWLFVAASLALWPLRACQNSEQQG